MTLTATRNRTLETALAQAEERFAAANPKSLARHEEAERAMPGGNTRTVLFYRPFPLTIANAEGAAMVDIDGHRYIDFLGEYSAGVYGHSNPKIMAALHTALDHGISYGAPGAHEAAFAQAMVDRFPSVERIRFTNSGTESNLMAIVTAIGVTRRSEVMVFEGGYHGAVLSYPPGGSPINAPFDIVTASYNEIEATREAIRAHRDSLACVLLEPMMGSGGAVPATVPFLEMLREETRAAGIILIFDEVMTSRLSPGGLQAKTGVIPDLTSFGKYLGGGMSFGAFGGRAALMDRYDPSREGAWKHPGTFNNNVMTMTAGLTGLTQVFTPEACEALNASGDDLRARLNALADKTGVPIHVSGVGSLMNVHFQREAVVKPSDTAKTPVAARDLFHLGMIERGIYLARRGYMTLSLALDPADHNALLAAVEDFLEENRDVLPA